MTTQRINASVTEPINQAFNRVKLVLFHPFDIGKWFVIGFCAWLATLGEGGGSYGAGNYKSDVGDTQRNFERGRDFVMENLQWIIPVAIAAVALVVVISFVVVWLNSRGRFMFLHCVALNKAEVVLPWEKYARHGNSLFLFRIILGILASIFAIPLLAIIGVSIYGMVQHGAPHAGGILTIVAAFLVMIVVGIIFALITKLTMDFVVPIMYLRGKSCLDAWKEFRGLLSGNMGNFALYILFQILIVMVIGTMMLIATLLTCCIAALPYIGTVILLPLIVFSRAYSLHYLAQFGPTYDVFAAGTPPTAGAIS